MKSVPIAVLAISLISCCLFAQEDAEQSAQWEIMPGATVVKLFPGAPFKVGESPYAAEQSYSGTGLRFTARSFTPEYPNLALTFGAGITWYYDSQDHYPIVSSSPDMAGIGELLWRKDFTVFPVSIGAQIIFPSRAREDLMFFAGGEGNVNFIDGEIMPGQQTKIGYTLLGGFAVKAFEFGIRYTAFSDMKNLGVHLGLRFKTFGL
jgi:hypothetical protein